MTDGQDPTELVPVVGATAGRAPPRRPPPPPPDPGRPHPDHPRLAPARRARLPDPRRLVHLHRLVAERHRDRRRLFPVRDHHRPAAGVHDLQPAAGDPDPSAQRPPTSTGAQPEQHPLWIRAVWFLLVGWWLGAIYMTVAWTPVRDPHHPADRAVDVQPGRGGHDAAAVLMYAGEAAEQLVVERLGLLRLLNHLLPAIDPTVSRPRGLCAYEAFGSMKAGLRRSIVECAARGPVPTSRNP